MVDYSGAIGLYNGTVDPVAGSSSDLLFIKGGVLYRAPAGGGTPIDLTGVAATRAINTGAGLTGGGNLTADRTIAVPNNGITNALLAQAAASTLKGNNTGGAANVSDLTAAQVKVLLAIAVADITGLSFFATLANLSGDVSTSGSGVTTLGNNKVTNAILAQAAANTLKGNNTGGAANVADLTPAQVKTLLAIASGDVSGLSFFATLANLSGDISTSGSGVTSLGNNKVTNAVLAQAPANTVKGNNTSAAANEADLTVAQLETMRSWNQATRAMVADNASFTNVTTEQLFPGAQFTIPANTLAAGDTLYLHIGASVAQAAVATATNTLIKVHLGPLGTTADPIVAATAVNLNGTVATTHALIVDAFITMRTTTTALGDVDAHGSAIIAPVAATVGQPVLTAITVNPAVANILTPTLQQPTANITGSSVRVACIKRVV